MFKSLFGLKAAVHYTLQINKTVATLLLNRILYVTKTRLSNGRVKNKLILKAQCLQFLVCHSHTCGNIVNGVFLPVDR